MTRTMHARRASACPMCGQGIAAGEVIARKPYGAGVWAHVACVEQFRRDVAADDLDSMTMGYGA